MSPQPATQRSSEPSMEEILASIRKIIADDQKALDAGQAPTGTITPPDRPRVSELPVERSAPEAVPPVGGDDDEGEDVLDLELATETPAPVEPAYRSPTAEAPRFVPPYQPEPQSAASLISDAAALAAGRSFQSLANTVFAQNARTLDDVVRDMLRPMLQSWLDENLPALVERLVRAEIERVARGGR